MADEPVIQSGVDFLNHVRRVLDASLQRWEFIDFVSTGDYSEAEILFLGTGRKSLIFHDGEGWHAEDSGKDDHWLTARLNGHVRDEAGNLSSPLRIEAGKWYERCDGKIVGPACQIQMRMQNDFHKWIVNHIYYGDCGRGMSDGSDWHGDLIREVPAPAADEAGVMR